VLKLPTVHQQEADQGREEQVGDERGGDPAVHCDEQVLGVADRAGQAAGGDGHRGQQQQFRGDPGPGGDPEDERGADDRERVVHQQGPEEAGTYCGHPWCSAGGIVTGPAAGAQTLLVSHHDHGNALSKDNFLYILTDPL